MGTCFWILRFNRTLLPIQCTPKVVLGIVQIELNRVKGKPPYRELKGEGSLKAQADEAWDYAHSRSSSVIQDVFAGQLQSTLQCPACGALSHTFDEFMDLSLPLPQKSSLSMRRPTCTIQVNLPLRDH